MSKIKSIIKAFLKSLFVSEIDEQKLEEHQNYYLEMSNYHPPHRFFY